MTAYKALSDIADIIMGQAPPSSSYNDQKIGLPLIQGNRELKNGSIHVDRYCSQPTKTAQATDLIITVRAPVGELAISDSAYCLGRGVAAIRARTIDSSYLYYFLENSKKKLLISSQGSTFEAINSADLKALQIRFPKQEDQRKIAAVLRDSDSVIIATQKVIDQTEKLKKYLLYRLLESSGWRTGSLRDLTDEKNKNAIKPGPFGSSLKKDSYIKSGYKVYGQEQVISGNPRLGNYYISEEKYNDLEAFKVAAGDILMSLVGTVGKVMIIPDDFEKGVINPRLIKVSPDINKASPQFIKYLLESEPVKNQLATRSHGGTMNILNKSILQSITVKTPPLSEQINIAKMLGRIDELIKSNRQIEEAQKRLKQSLMRDLLTGKVQI